MEELCLAVPKQVKNDFEGMSFLNKVLNAVNNSNSNKVTLNFKKTRWFEANLTSIFGAVIDRARSLNKEFSISHISNSIHNVFKKNGFLEYYDLGRATDVFQSSIKFKIFNVNQSDSFAEYVSSEVIPKIRMTIAQPVQKSFNSSLNEIFVNVGLHAKSNTVFTCGQYYHTHKKVAFTIVDLGNTIPQNIKNKYGFDCTDKELINWSTIYGNSTREISGIGGLGLSMIDKFLKDNKGIFQILSGTGFWERDAGSLFATDLKYHFPGTIVNIITKLENTSFQRTEDILF